MKNSPEMKFEEYSYFKKLRKLNELEDKLYYNDMNKKGNRSGVKTFGRLLQKGSQSYFIFDNEDFKIARKIYYEVDEFGISGVEHTVNKNRLKLLGQLHPNDQKQARPSAVHEEPRSKSGWQLIKT